MSALNSLIWWMFPLRSVIQRKGHIVCVCVITVPQVRMVGACKQFHRQTDFDSQFLSKMKFFGNDDVIPNVDATILLGDFSLEDEALPEKMLLVRLNCSMSNSMLSREEKEEMASNIYSSLRPLSGRNGYEMRRFGGSSGKTCHESDINLLRVLADNKGALPRKTWATVILRGPA